MLLFLSKSLGHDSAHVHEGLIDGNHLSLFSSRLAVIVGLRHKAFSPRSADLATAAGHPPHPYQTRQLLSMKSMAARWSSHETGCTTLLVYLPVQVKV